MTRSMGDEYNDGPTSSVKDRVEMKDGIVLD